ncbi:MAG: hypothetical protein ACI3ZG_06500 [Candidatus Coprenecus sp.]
MKKLIFSLVLLFSASMLFGQGKYGADSAECVKYLSFYTQYMKQGNIDEAAPSWRKAISICPPTASQNMLLDGMKIMRREIGKYKNNPVRKKELVDSLMLLHTLRLENYPKYRVTAQTNLAKDMINYSEKGQEENVYNVLGQTMDITKEKTDITVAVRYLHYAIELYKNGTFTEEQVLQSFNKSINVLESVNQAKPSESAESAIQDVENMFAQSGVASCDGLMSLFAPRYEQTPDDKALLQNIVSLFTAANCTDSELFRAAIEGLHKLDPSHHSAYLLYKLYASSSAAEDIEKAKIYMKEAIDAEDSDLTADGDYYYEYATFCFKMGDNVEAIDAAKKSAAISETNAGKAFFLIGTIWGTTQCKGNEVESRAQFWVATDYMNKAKKLDPSLEAEANKQIANFAKYYPEQANAFMYDIVDGDSFTVSCNGMRETTTVRTLK